MHENVILLVDDDRAVTTALKHILEMEGFSVLKAENGQKGLKLLKKTTPDLILLDVKMPKMSGIEFINHISRSDGSLDYPVLVLTALGDMASLFKDVPIDGFLHKPCTPDELMGEVNRILEERGRPTPSQVRRKTVHAAKQVLLIESDADISSQFVNAFADAGYGVDVAADGNDGVGRAILSPPSIVLANRIMPGITGKDIQAILQRVPRTSSLPVIIYDDGVGEVKNTEALLERSRNHADHVSNRGAADLLEKVRDAIGPAS